MNPKEKLISTFFSNSVVRNLLPDDHPLVQLKKQINWNAIRNQLMTDTDGNPIEYSPVGRPAWDPLIIFKMLILQIWDPASDHKVEQRANTDLAYRYFLDLPFPMQVPDETTLSRYRSKWGEEKVRELNIIIIKQIQDKGLANIKSGVVGDTTHQHAPVQKPTARQLLADCLQKFIKELEEFLEKNPFFKYKAQLSAICNSYQLWCSQYSILIKAEKLSKAERFSKLILFILKVQETFEQILPEIQESFADTIAGKTVLSVYELLLQLLKENASIESENDEMTIKQKKKGRKIISLTDIDARPGQKSKDKKFFGYKVATLRTKDGYIIEANTEQGNKNDGPMAKTLLEAILQNNQEIPEAAAFDKAFSSIENRKFMHAYGIQPGIEFKGPTNPKNPDKFSNEDFIVDLEVMTATCPAGQTTDTYATLKKPDRYQFKFSKRSCDSCILREQCTSSKTGRTIQISQYQLIIEQDKAFLETESYDELRKARWGQEGDYGWGKKAHGLAKSRYRGLKKTAFFNRMVFIVQNLKRYLNHRRNLRKGLLKTKTGGRPSVSSVC